MRTSLALRFVVCASIAVLGACHQSDVRTTPDAAATSDKIPITSSSDEARALYLRGRALTDKLRVQDARELYEEAAAKDPTFAMAQYSLALGSPTKKALFEHLTQAVALSEKASEGERLTILTLQATANADPTKALQYAHQLAVMYPRDERAHLTLGIVYFQQQQYDRSVAELETAIAVEPSYSPAYNSLGYALRPLGRDAEAEVAFKKYIALVPDDPNPYDSYAELLMKTGRFDESVAQYRKALSIDPHFGASHVGIASDYMFQGNHDAAIAEAQTLYDAALDDGDRRSALTSQTLTYVDAGKTAEALATAEKQYALGAKIGDSAAMASDAVLMGNILLFASRADDARGQYAHALALVEGSSQSVDFKKDAQLADHYNVAQVALARSDLATAKAEALSYQSGAEARRNLTRVRQAHELNGTIAVREKRYEQAIAELAQASQQDPLVLYMTALAAQGEGDASKAKELARQAAEMHILPTLSYVLVRTKAQGME